MPRNEGCDIRQGPSSSFLWRRYLCGWIVVATIILIDAIWLLASGYSVQKKGVVAILQASVFFLISAASLNLLARVERYTLITKKLRCTELSETALWLTLLLCFVSTCCVLSYLCVTVDAPLIDTNLARLDHALGFDWQATYFRVRAHPGLQHILQLAYDSGRWQLIGIPVVLGLSRRREELSELLLLLILSSILLMLISTPFPAASAFVHFNITDPNTASTVSDFAALRDGTLRSIDLTNAQGLVSMPSFHTTLGVFFAYVFRRSRMLFPLAALLNLGMIISTPTQGGHYLVDVFAGLLFAALNIWILQYAIVRCGAQPAATISQ